MSTGLLSQLEAYFADVDSEQARVSPDRVAALIDQVREVPLPVRVERRRPVWAAAAAFVIVLVVVSGLALFAPFGGSGVAPIEQPMTSVPGLTSGIVWTEITDGDAGSPIDSVYGHPTNIDVARFGDSYVIPRDCRRGDCDWLISDDGLDWRTEAVPVEPPDGGTEYSAWVADETVWFIEEGLEDGGGINLPLGIADRGDPPGHLRILHNEGTTWVETRWVPPVGAEDGLKILSSRGMGTCLFTVSDEDIVFEMNYEPADGPEQIMVIQDGAFRAIPHPDDGGCVAGFLNGTLYALAGSTNGWSSHFWSWNGDTWSRLPDPEGVGPTANIDNIVPLSSGFQNGAIIGGRVFVGGGGGRIWTTTDFETWTLTDAPQNRGRDGVTIQTHLIRATAFGWTAPADFTSNTAYATMNGIAYVTANGVTWNPIDAPTAAFGSLSYAGGVFVYVADSGVWAGVPVSP
jgi:hypothetical protein